MSETPELRVSDADREATLVRLREAAGEGRLTLEELSERVERTDEARTASDLEAITADLPAARAATVPAKQKGWVVAILGGAERKGSWRPARRTNVITLMGGAALDLREVELPGPEIEITAVTIMGGIEVIVPEGVQVELNDFAIMGGNTGPRNAKVPPGAPVVRVRAYSLMGGIGVTRKKPGESGRRPHRWH